MKGLRGSRNHCLEEFHESSWLRGIPEIQKENWSWKHVGWLMIYLWNSQLSQPWLPNYLDNIVNSLHLPLGKTSNVHSAALRQGHSYFGIGEAVNLTTYFLLAGSKLLITYFSTYTGLSVRYFSPHYYINGHSSSLLLNINREAGYMMKISNMERNDKDENWLQEKRELIHGDKGQLVIMKVI